MLNAKSAVLLTAMTLALTACGGGGGGGGGGDSAPPATTSPGQGGNNGGENGGNTSTELPTTPVASYASGGKISGYTYTTPEGRQYLMRESGVTVTGVRSEILTKADGTYVSATSWCCGTMSYTTFGTWTNYQTNQHEVFYTGEPTAIANVPTQGSATYAGTALRGAERGSAVFNVDFATKAINGNITAEPGTNFGSAIALQGKITNGGFTGSAQSGGENGSFIGHFNGPAAQELAGAAKFADSSKDTSFGASKL